MSERAITCDAIRKLCQADGKSFACLVAVASDGTVQITTWGDTAEDKLTCRAMTEAISEVVTAPESKRTTYEDYVVDAAKNKEELDRLRAENEFLKKQLAADLDDERVLEVRFPAPRVTDNEAVLNLLLLTDAAMTRQKPLGPPDEEILQHAISTWNDDEKASAAEWAALSHIAASDNDDVKVPTCPPHVQAIRPKYGNKN